MNTPSHVAASLLVWRDERDWSSVSAVVAGALVPDLPMFGFYAYQRLWAARSEKEIWTTLYFDETWQLLFDVFNSIPVAVVLILLFRWFGWRCAALVAASALLHMVCDLPLHHDDAHRHFLPFSFWRFESPVSYWDPRHFGVYFAIGEVTFSILACLFVGWRSTARPMRVAAIGTLSMYVLGIGFALAMWAF